MVRFDEGSLFLGYPVGGNAAGTVEATPLNPENKAIPRTETATAWTEFGQVEKGHEEKLKDCLRWDSA